MPTAAKPVWRPSSARTIVLDSFVPVPRGTTAAAAPPLSWPIKDPADVLDYQFDISPALVGNDGDSIATLDVVISPAAPGDLTLERSAVDGAVAVLWLAGGQAGTTYNVTLTLTSANGRSLQRTVLLPVLALSTPPVPANALQTDSGNAVTDESGHPIIAGP